MDTEKLKKELKSRLKNIKGDYGTPRFDFSDNDCLQVRYLGKWKSDPFEEDDDQEELEDESADQIQEIINVFQDDFKVKISWNVDEKNWISFYFE